MEKQCLLPQLCGKHIPNAPKGLGGSNDARFQAIDVAPAANGCLRDDGERVVVVSVKGWVLGDVVEDKREQRRRGRWISHVDVLRFFFAEDDVFWLRDVAEGVFKGSRSNYIVPTCRVTFT